MVIQRWQTLLLLIAAVSVSLFCFSPVAVETLEAAVTKHYLSEAPVLMIVNVLIAVLLILDIFLFKNLKLQRKVALLTMVLTCASLVASLFLVNNWWPTASLYWFGGIIFLGVALVVTYWAYRLMGKDQALLRSYDRLR